ncbi:SAM-dependent methyltransferase [Umezawaea sp. Da 62-37]|uniref:SAM-dependent methyltransferase n=1 Tax=Umezawaea sp. Da 62-37 TaxID=3075927 RepID=UPI0028F6F871|nr:SAM-dependent methyltransferase [Umezawaea sp. Da 62-37]WNV86562.1 SAM-dependent methyltransferase [Umezawaea sp. Da 62-37]
MSDEVAAVPEGIDLNRPSAARVYDYYLGGAHNFAVDRAMGEQAIGMWPDLPLIMQANRAFLRRAVRYCVAAGIRQFLDLGSGIPTVGNVHEVARLDAPDARVVYVDIDPVAVAHSRSILGDDDHCAVVQADMRRPDVVLNSPQVGSLLDLSQPVAVMMVAVLHFVPDSDDPARIVAAYGDVVAPGSVLVMSHATDGGGSGPTAEHRQLYTRTATPMNMRSPAQVTALFEGFDIVDPGVVFLPLWRPASPDDVDGNPERFTGLAAVGRKR